MQLQYFTNLEKFDSKSKKDKADLLLALQMMIGLPDLYIPQRFRDNKPASIHFRKMRKQFMRARMERQMAIEGFGKPSDFPASEIGRAHV